VPPPIWVRRHCPTKCNVDIFRQHRCQRACDNISKAIGRRPYTPMSVGADKIGCPSRQYVQVEFAGHIPSTAFPRHNPVCVITSRLESVNAPCLYPSGLASDPYEILAPTGAGGIGEVYRARDTKLESRSSHQDSSGRPRAGPGPPLPVRAWAWLNSSSARTISAHPAVNVR